ATYTHSPAAIWTGAPSRPLTVPLVKTRPILLALTVLALAVRVSALSTYGFSEDEINKVRAIEAYRAGQFSANAEHPMLMKLAMWGSVSLTNAWNRHVASDKTVSLETAIRLPNAIAGAATTVAVFGVADLLFGAPVGLVGAAIWALDVNAIATNRIGKEDSLLLLFFLVAVFCYERAKRIGSVDLRRAQRWYALSGAAFGLMFASKYMLHYFGIYALFNLLTDLQPGSNKPDRISYFGAMGLAFLVANPALILPATWRYIASYLQGDMLLHHGYLYAGALYVVDVPI